MFIWNAFPERIYNFDPIDIHYIGLYVCLRIVERSTAYNTHKSINIHF